MLAQLMLHLSVLVQIIMCAAMHVYVTRILCVQFYVDHIGILALYVTGFFFTLLRSHYKFIRIK